ncbi:MAG: bifunctional adenosylcobinamide kinase/adenosylcobinamide-phosphate guanylyltransferase [Dehalococcoidia bacterium]|nr:bifunctional adenosylcobinamide kinase/adenosylcobinamide-phosphate guanylyltransferase [Dehalococcoidia bacterium]
MGDLLFVTGGSRSGKSEFAEALARGQAAPVIYVATLEARDEEMLARVDRHATRRPEAWHTLEAPATLALAVLAAPRGECLLVDSLSGWVANRLLALGEQPTAAAVAALEAALLAEAGAIVARAAERAAPTIVVSDEVGSGLVPEYALGRTYRDLLGSVNQALSRAATHAWLVVAGRALALPPP